MGIADHFEEAAFALLAVHDPVGIENLVAAVLRVDLRKHDELGIGRVALHLLVGGDEVVDLLRRHGEAPVDVGLMEGLRSLGHKGDGAQWGGLEVLKKVADVIVDRLGHAVVENEQSQTEVVHAQHEARLGGEGQVDAALDPEDVGEGAVVEDIGGLG